MIFRTLSKMGDWTLGKGRSGYTRNIEALILNVKTRLLSWVGDCFYAPAEGVDYSNYLGYGTKQLLDLNIKRVVLKSQGVIKIVNFESKIQEDRNITIRIIVDTILGQATVEV